METAIHSVGLRAALSMAYNAVVALGISHQQLVGEYNDLNYNTLRRIREGKAGKPATDRFFLKLFVTILEKEYQRRIQRGGDGATDILRILKNVLLAELEISLS